MSNDQTPGPEAPKPQRGADLTPEERAAFKARSDEIGKRLEAARGQSETLPKATRGKGETDGSGMGRAMRASTELVGGILVGSLIGYGLDMVFKTGPLLFVVFFLLGSAAGILNVIRSTRPDNVKSGPSAKAVKDDDEDD